MDGIEVGGGVCRTDNGFCFARGGWDRATSWAVVEFRDGSVYSFGPVEEDDWIERYENATQPGCAWNFGERDKPPTRWRKLGGFPDGLVHVFEHVSGHGYKVSD